MTHDYAYKYEEIKAFAEKFLADGGLLSAVENYIIVPGLCDVHVHFREPGFLIKKPLHPARRPRRTEATRRSAPCRTSRPCPTARST